MSYKEVYKDPILARIEEEEKAAREAVNKKYRVGLKEAGSETHYFNTLKEAEEFVREAGKEACIEKRTQRGYQFFENMNMR
jgi:hypothetical protein